MEHSANVLRMALVISIIGHVLFMAFSARDLRPTSHGEVMTVDLVPANEAPAAATEPKTEAANQPAAQKPEPKAEKPEAPEKATSPKPTAKTPEAKPPEAKPPEPKAQEPKAPEPKSAEAKATPAKAPQSQPDPAQLAKWTEQQMSAVTDPKAVATPPAQTATMSAPAPGPVGPGREVAPNMNRLAATLGLPVDVMSGTSAEAMTKFTEGVKEFKAQVRRCFKLPVGISPNEPFQMIIRVALRPDGALAGQPEHIGGKFAPLGPALRDRALEAVRQCAPYRMPADHYEQWKVLDIDFSPDQMMGS